MLKLKLSLVFLLLPTLALAQDSIIQPEGLVQLAEHTWAIPDNNVGGVPNVGIVIGRDATLVIDPGLGRENGEIVLRAARELRKYFSENRTLFVEITLPCYQKAEVFTLENLS